MNRLKILVFDDSEIHRQSAVLTLGKDHDLTVVGTYDEAQEALAPGVDHNKAKQLRPDLLEKAGLSRDFNPYGKDKNASEADMAKYEAALDKSYELTTSRQNFDVVLTDLLVPASRQAQGDEGKPFVGQEMPLGTTIALLALCNGVRKVAVVTDKNHHAHPASAAFDCFERDRGMGPVEGVKILCTNRVGLNIAVDTATGEAVDWKFLNSEEGKRKYPLPEGQDHGDRRGIEWRKGKNWNLVLDQLLV